MLKLPLCLMGLMLALGSLSSAHAASGEALGVDPAAEARGANPRTLTVGEDIFIGDRIVTGGTGQVQILFSDRTELVVGPRSSLLIEDYLLREDGSAGRLVLDVLGGTYRFVTGGSRSDRYIIDTPTGQIGVRGTAFELFVTDRADYILTRQGRVIGCADGSGDCQVTRSKCEVMRINNREAEILGKPSDFDRDEREELEEWFPYAVNQTGLLRSFRIAGGNECFRDAPADGGGGSLVDIPFGDDGYESD